MRCEAQPADSFAADFRAIRQAKHAPRRERLRKLEPYVLARYADFVASSAQLETLPQRNFSRLAKDALRHCYDSSGQNLSRIKQGFLDELSMAALARCPYCMLRQPSTIDHFLPIDLYPEFAVLVLNWVYTCGTCNLRKGTGLIAAPRAVLNPYFDEISDVEPLLYAQVVIANDVPSVVFAVPDPNPLQAHAAVSGIATRQFEEFGLKRSLELEANSVLASTIGEIIYGAAGPITNQTLTERLQARRANLEDLGINDWQRCLYEAMEVCPNLLEHVNGRIANRPPKQPPPPPRDLGIVLLAQQIAAAGG